MDIYPAKEDHLLLQSFSPLQEIKVYDKLNGFRYMTQNGVQQGGNLPGKPERLVLPYFRGAAASLAFVDDPVDFLIIGLGIGAVPSYLRAVLPGSMVDVVEIDPVVPQVAKEWFGLREDDGLKVIIGDGRDYVNSAPRRYDMVFLDAYRDLEVPSRLTTLEFMEEVRTVLKPGGVVVSNLWGSVINPLFEACVATLGDAFVNLCQFRSYTYNFILIADTRPVAIGPGELLGRAKGVMSRVELGFDLVSMIRRQYSPIERGSHTAAPLRD